MQRAYFRSIAVAALIAIIMPIMHRGFESSLLVAQAAREDDAYTALRISTEGIHSDLLSGNFFSLDENMGQDLYKTIQERVRSEGATVAITRTTSRRSLSKEELYAIIPGSNIGAILAKPNPREPLTDEQIRQRRVDIIAELAEEKELADLEALTRIEVESTELFANGDESDSGFDLLVDLDVIETLLFAHDRDTMAGPGGGSNEDRALEPGPLPSRQADAIPRPARNQIIPNQDNNTSTQSNIPGVQIAPNTAQVECPTDADFNAAVEQQRQQDRNNGAPVVNKNEQNASDALGATEGRDNDVKEEQKSVQAAEADDWKRAIPCSTVFCLTVEAKYKTESSYTVDENCIACHIQKINDAFRKTLQHNLVPNKVTGNLLEGPKCKDALMGMNWLTSNIIFIGQPILTPPNDDIVVRGDLWANMKQAWLRYVDSPKKCDEGEACRIGVAERVLSLAKPNATFDDTTASLAQESRAIAQKKMREYRNDRLQQQAAATAEQYQDIIQELDTMNTFFENFMKLFEDLTNDPETSPCGILANKKYCS